MKTFRIFLLSLIFISLFTLPDPASAQDYRYTVSTYEVEAYIEADGTLSLSYYMEFQNAPNGAAIDFIDVGMPTPAFSQSVIEAQVDDLPITKIEDSPYVTYGFALNLEDKAIPPGQSGIVTIWIPGVENVLYEYDEGDRENYASFLFSPNWFDPSGDKTSETEYRMTIILPPDGRRSCLLLLVHRSGQYTLGIQIWGSISQHLCRRGCNCCGRDIQPT